MPSRKKESGGDQLLVQREYSDAAKLFEKAANKAGVRPLRAVLYSLRHCGASQDAGDKVRTVR